MDMLLSTSCRSTAWALLVLILAFPVSGRAQDEAEPPAAEGEAAADEGGNDLGVEWVEGPKTCTLGDIAQIQISEGYRFTGGDGTRLILQAGENPVNGSELGLIMPNGEDPDWFVVFEYDPSGYISDDDKDDLDADAMLEVMKANNERGNATRRERGWAELEIVGWEHPPHYDPETRNLEWALKAKSEEGHMVVNYNTRVLGRGGVMEVALVVSPEQLATTLDSFKILLGDFSYTEGNSYGEYLDGDKVAQYGLAALVTGGAVAVAAKSGFLQKFFKFIIVGVIAVGVFFKNLVFGKEPEQDADESGGDEPGDDLSPAEARA